MNKITLILVILIISFVGMACTPIETPTPTITPTNTIRPTNTAIPTNTATATKVNSLTPTYTNTPFPTNTPTATSTETLIPSETPTIEVTATITPITGVRIIFISPNMDNKVILTRDDTRFEIMAFDSGVGNNNGDGISLVEFEIYNLEENLIYFRSERLPQFCAFGGDTICNIAPSTLFTFIGDYNLRVRVRDMAGDWSEWANRPFNVDRLLLPTPNPTLMIGTPTPRSQTFSMGRYDQNGVDIYPTALKVNANLTATATAYAGNIIRTNQTIYLNRTPVPSPTSDLFMFDLTIQP